MKTLPHDITSEFLRLVKSKIELANNDIEKIKRNITFNENIILNNEEYTYSNDIIDYIKRVKAKKSSYSKYKVIELYKFNAKNNYSDNIKHMLAVRNDTLNNIIPIRYRKGIEVDIVELINSAYVNFRRYVVEYHKLNEVILRYEPLLLPTHTIRQFVMAYFKHIGRLILREKYAKFSLIPNIHIYIYGKSRKQNTDKTKDYKSRLKVDWGVTNRNVKAILKESYPKEYSKYINKEITKKEVYVFLNSKNIKYLQYMDKDINHWLVINSKFSNIEGVSDYGIVPVNYVSNETNSQIDFTNKVKDIDEIVSTNLLGFRDKLRALERVDMDFCRRNYLNNIAV